MAYDSGAQDARMIMRTVRGTFDFAGRSRRTEMVYYGIATALVGVMINFPAGLILPALWAGFLQMTLAMLFAVPTFALFVRRLHDQGKAGWWVILLGALLAAHAYQNILILSAGPGAFLLEERLMRVAMAMSILIVILSFWPGTDGPNAYGADPREEPESA